VVGGKVSKCKKIRWAHKEKKKVPKQKLRLGYKRRENKLNVPTTLVNTMREKKSH
jgi:hypothetical protein